MEMVKNSLNWFEIPVADFDRARKFYGSILVFDMPEFTMGQNRMGFFLMEQGVGVGGAIVSGPGYTPSDKGTLVYLNGGSDLSTVLNRIGKAGGTVAVPKTIINDELGYFAVFKDSEGNRVALHSMK